MDNYARGRSLEYAAKRRLQQSGFIVFRCASSKPVDLIAVKQGVVMLVECKTGLHPHISNGELAKALTLASQSGAKTVLCFRRKFHRLRFYEVLPSLERKELPF